MIFLPACPASQTHDSHKGHIISNHESPVGHIKNCGEKSAFGKNAIRHFVSETALKNVSVQVYLMKWSGANPKGEGF